eukprot:244737-Chlamydomonas_euryale.AAC.1
MPLHSRRPHDMPWKDDPDQIQAFDHGPFLQASTDSSRPAAPTHAPCRSSSHRNTGSATPNATPDGAATPWRDAGGGGNGYGMPSGRGLPLGRELAWQLLNGFHADSAPLHGPSAAGDGGGADAAAAPPEPLLPLGSRCEQEHLRLLGHSMPVLCLVLDAPRQRLYSASVDQSIKVGKASSVGERAKGGRGACAGSRGGKGGRGAGQRCSAWPFAAVPSATPDRTHVRCTRRSSPFSCSSLASRAFAVSPWL